MDEKGYRFYSVFQIDTLSLIIALRDLGLPLMEIRSYLSGGTPEELDSLLERQEQRLDGIMEQMRARKKLLNRARNLNRGYIENKDGGFRVIRMPEMRYDLLPDPTQEKIGILIMDYATEGGAENGIKITGEDMRIIQKSENGKMAAPEGNYLSFWGDTDGDYRSLLESVSSMELFAKENGMVLSGDFYVEFNDMIPHRDGMEYFSVRSGILPGQKSL